MKLFLSRHKGEWWGHRQMLSVHVLASVTVTLADAVCRCTSSMLLGAWQKFNCPNKPVHNHSALAKTIFICFLKG